MKLNEAPHNPHVPDTTEVRRSFVLSLMGVVDADVKREIATDAFDRWLESFRGQVYEDAFYEGVDVGRESGYWEGYEAGREAE